VDLSTYLLISGALHGGHIRRAIPFFLQSHFDAGFLQSEHLQPQLRAGFLQAAHVGTPLIPSAVNPSNPDPPTYFPRPNPAPKINTANAKRICGVNFKGITEAISSSTVKCRI
jgi:hypothetical protein